MKFKKYMAFTLAELMVMLSVLTVMLAAFAPVFTVRYNNASASGNIWSFIVGDDNNNAYSDHIGQLLTSQFFIGLTPSNKLDVSNSLLDSTRNNVLYSKLVIRATDKLKGGELQKQIRFLYGNTPKNKGADVGALFAGNGNFLLGGLYNKIEKSATYNSAYGHNALTNITSGSKNTALGVNAGSGLQTGSNNTLIGYEAGAGIVSGSNNTLIGYNSGKELKTGSWNTIIGNFSGAKGNFSASTIVGNFSGSNAQMGTGNTVVGNHSLSGDSSGSYNTVVGYNSLNAKEIGSYNTVIGANAGNIIKGSNKTVVGANSASDNNFYGSNWLIDDKMERVFIGNKPVSSTFPLGMSVLEVHNVPGNGSTRAPFLMDNSSVVINGNLIVRGQSYLTARVPFLEGDSYDYPSLVGFVLKIPKRSHHRIYMGADGNERTTRVMDPSRGRIHHKYGGNENCVCARACGSRSVGITSYDWSTPYYGTTVNPGQPFYKYGGTYRDGSTNWQCANNVGHGSLDIDLNMAHTPWSGGNCCPNLVSDIRLKDLNSPFYSGLDKLSNINVYNFTFKDDKNDTPQVGVMAQDLKRVFPTAVTKDDKGYYKIRWDEMFYSAINAIKEINNKVVKLASRVESDRARITALKEDNVILEKKLEVLAEELTQLERERNK